MARDTRLLPRRAEIEETVDHQATAAEFTTYGSELSNEAEDCAAAEAPQYEMPLFPSEAVAATGRERMRIGLPWAWINQLWLPSTILKAGLVVAVAGTIAFGAVYRDDTLNLIDSVKTSLFGPAADQSVAEQDASEALPADPPSGKSSMSPFPASTVGVRTGSTTGRVSPTRDEIALALRSARRSLSDNTQYPGAAAAARALSPDEVAAMVHRAKGLLASGDIVAARLLLQRAANAPDVTAVLLLAETYDPAVLGNPDARTITPDPAIARSWYQRAAELGSPDAKQRLAQMQN